MNLNNFYPYFCFVSVSKFKILIAKQEKTIAESSEEIKKRFENFHSTP